MHTDLLRASEMDAPTAFYGLRYGAFAPCDVSVPTLSPPVLSLTAAILLVNAPAIAQQPQPTALETIIITSADLPEPKDATKRLPVYPGGQIAIGARAEFLGNRDYSDLPFSAVGYPCNKGPVLALYPHGAWCRLPHIAATRRFMREVPVEGGTSEDLKFHTARLSRANASPRKETA